MVPAKKEAGDRKRALTDDGQTRILPGMITFDDEEAFEAAAMAVAKRLAARMEDAGQGRTRRAFFTPSGKHVVKVPLSWAGAEDNGTEAATYAARRGDPDCVLAPCRMSSVNGFPVLVMKRLDTFHLPPYEMLPQWTQCFDCCQVGFTPEGKLLAFDYGIH